MTEPKNARLTGVRREVKYKVDPQSGRRALDKLLQKVPPKIVDGHSSSYRVSIYLDDRDRSLSSGEINNDKVVTKMRVREYYLLDGSLPLFGEKCFMEVKTRAGQMVEKNRFSVERPHIEEVLQNGPAAPLDTEERAAHEAFEAMREGKALEPIFVVHYRRFTLQDKENRIRLTVDDMLSYHMPPPGLLSSEPPICSRKDLPPPFLVEPNWIIEVKSVGPAPLWLDDILNPNTQIQYSKFGTGVRELEKRNHLFIKEA